ncbi:MAG: ZIP family metal transporter [Pirellulaceae bacterium]
MPVAVCTVVIMVPAVWDWLVPSRPLLVLAIYCIAVIFASIAGGNLTQRLRMTHNTMQHVISLVGGVMLGTALFHLLPHALHGSAEGAVTTDGIMTAVVLGIVAMFAMLRLFHHHHHGEELAFQTPHAADSSEHEKVAHDRAVPTDVRLPTNPGEDQETSGHASCDHGAHDQHSPQHAHGPRLGRHSWIGVLVGLMIHTLIDGVTLAASVRMDATHGSGTGILLGFGTFLAVFLHKPLDAISITSLMAASGQSPRHRQWANFAFALTCPLGAAACYAGVAGGGPASTAIVAYVLAFSAGVFLCIALSDLLPEMEFHSHDRFTLTSMLLLGLLAAWMLRFLEGDLHGV